MMDLIAIYLSMQNNREISTFGRGKFIDAENSE